MSLCRHDTHATWAGGAWSAAPAFGLPDGLRVAGVGVAARGLTEGDAVAVDLQGTVLHPDAPDGAWASLWTATLTAAEPAAARLAEPVWVGTASWLRWVVATLSAPAAGASLHAVLAGTPG